MCLWTLADLKRVVEDQFFSPQKWKKKTFLFVGWMLVFWYGFIFYLGHILPGMPFIAPKHENISVFPDVIRYYKFMTESLNMFNETAKKMKNDLKRFWPLILIDNRQSGRVSFQLCFCKVHISIDVDNNITL